MRTLEEVVTARAPRLCMVVHSEYPADVRVAREARAAVRAGFDVDVLALSEPDAPAEEVVDGVRVIRLPVEHRRGAGFVRVIGEYLGFTIRAGLWLARRSLRRRYDVVQVHNPPDFLVAAAIVPRLLGARIVFDIHDLAPDMFAMRFEHRPGARIADAALRVVERSATRLATTVITVHEPYRRELIARGVPPDKTVVVMNSVDERVLPPPAPADSNGFRVVYHGTVTPHYGVELVVDALRGLRESVPTATLGVYGTGDAVPALRERATRLGLAEAVTIEGTALTHGEVLARIAGASVGVAPNLPTRLNRFALSTKLFEYVALGIPAVCADLPTLREHFSDSEVYFFRAGDAESLRQALEAVAADPDEARERAAAASERARAYSWTENGARYIEVLRAAAARAAS
jgi:glycosyltransferase involved in cell wall biosynthesis